MNAVAEPFRLHQRMEILHVGMKAIAFWIAGEDEIQVAESVIADGFGKPLDEPSKILVRREPADIQDQPLARWQSQRYTRHLLLSVIGYRPEPCIGRFEDHADLLARNMKIADDLLAGRLRDSR